MTRWRPDPSFYPSPKLAGEAPPEETAYVALLNASDDERPDALGVVDVRPDSPTYATLVSRVDMSGPGDESDGWRRWCIPAATCSSRDSWR